MTIGARELLNKYGSQLEVCKAYICNKLTTVEKYYVDELVDLPNLTLARSQLQLQIEAGIDIFDGH